MEWTDGRISDRFRDHERRISHNEDVIEALGRLPQAMAEMRTEVRDAASAAAAAAEQCRRETAELQKRLDERDEEREREKQERKLEKAQERQERRQDRRVFITASAMLLCAIIGAAAAIIAAGAHP